MKSGAAWKRVSKHFRIPLSVACEYLLWLRSRLINKREFSLVSAIVNDLCGGRKERFLKDASRIMLKTTHPQIISTIEPLWWKAHYGRLSVTFWRPTMALSNILGMFINWIGPYPDARNGQKYRHKRFIRIVRSSLQKMVLNSGEGTFDTSYIERA